jgi:hypothetical protein
MSNRLTVLVENSSLVWSLYANGSLLVGTASNNCPLLKSAPLIQPRKPARPFAWMAPHLASIFNGR